MSDNSNVIKSLLILPDYTKPLTIRYAIYQVRDALTNELKYYQVEDSYNDKDFERFGEDMVIPEVAYRFAVRHMDWLNQNYEIQESFKLTNSLAEELMQLRDMGVDIFNLPYGWFCLPQKDGSVEVMTRLRDFVTTLDNMAAVSDYLRAYSQSEKLILERMKLTRGRKKNNRKVATVR